LNEGSKSSTPYINHRVHMNTVRGTIPLELTYTLCFTIMPIMGSSTSVSSSNH